MQRSLDQINRDGLIEKSLVKIYLDGWAMPNSNNFEIFELM